MAVDKQQSIIEVLNLGELDLYTLVLDILYSNCMVADYLIVIS